MNKMGKKKIEPEAKSKAAACQKPLAKKVVRQSRTKGNFSQAGRRTQQLRASSPELSSDMHSEQPSSEEPESSPSPLGKTYDPAGDTSDSSDDFAGLEVEGGEDERPCKKQKSNTGRKLSTMFDLLQDNNKQLKVRLHVLVSSPRCTSVKVDLR